jgi:hypothetical protein
MLNIPSGDNTTLQLPNVATSTDGIRWTESYLPNFASAVAFGADRFVAVGGPTNFVSSDGVFWQAVPVPAPGNWLASIAFGNGRFVAAAQSLPTVLTSANGVDWTRINVPSDGLDQPVVCFGAGIFLVASSAQLLSARDRLIWTVHPRDWNVYAPHGFCFGLD